MASVAFAIVLLYLLVAGTALRGEQAYSILAICFGVAVLGLAVAGGHLAMARIDKREKAKWWVRLMWGGLFVAGIGGR
jgi:hypothetical protein